jgi:hydrogenase expression/formation protein HypC
MCLAVPGKVVRWLDRDPLLARAEIEFGGICRICQMACVPEANVGDYVIVHAGIAISVVDRVAAERTLTELARLEEDDGWATEVAE